MQLRFKVLAITALTGGLVLGTASIAVANPNPNPSGRAASSASPSVRRTPKVKNYKNTFTRNTKGWCNFAGDPCDGAPGDSGTIVRTDQESSTYAYAPGINAESGRWYATVDGATQGTSTCPTYPAQDESCDGPYTSWGNPKGNYDTFPTNGFTSSLDIYLDTAWAGANPGNEFEWDTAVNQSNGQFGQDFIFTAQTGPGGFTIGAGNNSTSSVPTPSATIASSGWYRFIESFATNPMTGNVEATLSIVDDATATAVPGASWVIPVIFNGNAVPAASVGGPAYGWFPNENIPELPIDNSTLHKG